MVKTANFHFRTLMSLWGSCCRDAQAWLSVQTSWWGRAFCLWLLGHPRSRASTIPWLLGSIDRRTEWKWGLYHPTKWIRIIWGKAKCGKYHIYCNIKSKVNALIKNGCMSSLALQVYCDMENDGGRWTVLQRRVGGSVDFYRNWENYTHGFWSLEGEHWLGLSKLYRLANVTSP